MHFLEHQCPNRQILFVVKHNWIFESQEPLLDFMPNINQSFFPNLITRKPKTRSEKVIAETKFRRQKFHINRHIFQNHTSEKKLFQFPNYRLITV
ncbi:hypothetical protein BpHYR1_039688 [Brachionus plicatilis]|uniref:Uncharacterized protein n=1 Tax=Brachionus plicatilis TaxID=10195 RepID=A0A3M7QC48_BRAPC|nr:hypothetical protein BpHYR1_039688 [Brachionus plicatilis]